MKCPYCGSEKGYRMLEYVRRNLEFTFDGEPDVSTDDVTIYSGKTAYCRECERRLPKDFLKN